MEYKVKCKQCGLPYRKGNPKPGYCSEKCRNLALLVKCIKCDKPFMKKTFRQVKHICPECRDEDFEVIEVKKCPVCQTDFTTKDGRRIYCSTECRKKAPRRSSGQTYEKTCSHCGQVFKDKFKEKVRANGQPVASFCSDKCRHALIEKKCACCGNSFTVERMRSERTKYCSDVCKSEVKRKQDKEARAKYLNRLAKNVPMTQRN